MRQLKAALVGMGNMGRNHLRVLNESDAFSLKAIVEPNPPSPLPRLREPLAWLDSIEDLKSLDLDCVIVATPTETHYEIVKKLIPMGWHILVEKPAASTYEQAQELTKLAAERGVFLAVGNIERCNPVVSKLKKVLEEGVIGTPVHLNATRGGAFPNSVKPGNNVILDLAVHDLDVFRLLLGPLAVQGSVAHATALPGILDTAEVTVANGEGITGAVHVNWLSPQKIREIRVTGTKGVCIVDYIGQTCRVFGRDLAEDNLRSAGEFEIHDHPFCTLAEFHVEPGEPLKVQLEQWQRCLEKQDHNLATGDQLSESVALAEQSIVLAQGGLEPGFFKADAWKPHFSADRQPLPN
ncbi:Gfo/Idh/MocA family protein [Pseudobacteriovorax antillogorgiicola]|uniref:UDP-N-acetylglucosamine 3-dehydrogenase n=1 Tax=Pseudobacteriovorax antillogorgiicola TaxID=1513793 RepID=A0A1Y6CN30_9BACT|nr:Gfo/Idh/MocA family oxidoreductase [Pseudobacteriovorax antillogorgiicola]TCS45010.1 UDP-N-acetylglucosamine 3-dehydrogenase [Pseudobacteriovorax antillogorgiicola]SMF76397.1 UDP-N-acetylglucosamine 3-dehydrogenase [Pseudobacteriovorax antillogorgiicola]